MSNGIAVVRSVPERSGAAQQLPEQVPGSRLPGPKKRLLIGDPSKRAGLADARPCRRNGLARIYFAGTSTPGATRTPRSPWGYTTRFQGLSGSAARGELYSAVGDGRVWSACDLGAAQHAGDLGALPAGNVAHPGPLIPSGAYRGRDLRTSAELTEPRPLVNL